MMKFVLANISMCITQMSIYNYIIHYVDIFNKSIWSAFYWFDIYFDEKLLSTVNIGIRLEFQSKLETLTNEKIETELQFIRTKIINQFQGISSN